MCKRILSIVTALLILIPLTALNCLALENKSAGQTEYGDRTFVPLRAISEGFGAAVDWFEPLKTITISY